MTTYKSGLSRAFLASAVRPYLEGREAKPNELKAAVLITTRAMDADGLLHCLLRHCGVDALKKSPEGKLLKWLQSQEQTGWRTEPDDLSRKRLTEELRLRQALTGDPAENDETAPLSRAILCRRIEVHHVSAAGLVHLVTSVVDEAINLLRHERRHKQGRSGDEESAEQRRPFNGQIGVVIEDWNTIKAAYPEAAADPLVLPYITQYLRREGVTSLIVDTEPGVPLEPAQGADLTLRALAEQHLYTWLVPFYGERRVAITAVPPVSPQLPAMICELRPVLRRTTAGRQSPSDVFDNERLVVDPHFEMFSGLESGQTARVPLRVRLYVGNRPPDHPELGGNYLRSIRALLRDLFASSAGDTEVVAAVDMASYDLLRDYSYLQNGTRLDHTFVIEVDEFWADSHRTLLDLGEYMGRDLPLDAEDPLREIEDPYKLFIRTRPDKDRDVDTGRDRRREVFFQAVHLGHGEGSVDFGNNCSKYNSVRAEDDAVQKVPIDKVPFLWDFGFLLCPIDVWARAAKQTVQLDTVSYTVADFWNVLSPFDLDRGVIRRSGNAPYVPSGFMPGDSDHPGRWIRWSDLFRVCRTLRQQPSDTAFDLDLRTGEALSCLILEVWYSNMLAATNEQAGLNESDRLELLKLISSIFRANRYNSTKGGLAQLLEDPRARCLLYLSLGMVFSNVGGIEVREQTLCTRSADPAAVCARHFYSTATDERFNDGRHALMRMPGFASCRGDWFLSMAKGSRSPRLGERVIDLLSSRRGNLERLKEGLGLPVRNVISAEHDTSMRTALRWTAVHGAASTASFEPYIDYATLLAVSPAAARLAKGHPGHNPFQWLWRSTLRHYDLHARGWLRWLTRMWESRSLYFDSADAEEILKDNAASAWYSTYWPTARTPATDPASAQRKEKCRRFEDDAIAFVRELIDAASSSARD